MQVIKCTRQTVVNEIRRLNGCLTDDPERRGAALALRRAEQIFDTQVDSTGVAIVCEEGEISGLVAEYIEMLSTKHHLAICTFIEQGASVYAVRKAERLKEHSVYSLTLPCGSAGDKIVVFVCYYSAYEGEIYDIDLISKRFCS